jgi:hypothetical protein
MYFRDCKALSVFERKIPLTLEFRFHQEVIMTLISLDPCQWSLMSLITGNKVKKHTSQGIVKKKRTKSTKEF